MDTRRMIRVIGISFVGFLTLLCAHAVLLLALAASFDIFGSRISPLSWFLFIVVIPPLVTVAAALPAIALGTSKKQSFIAGFIACILAIFIFQTQREFWPLNPTDTLASITAVGVPVLAASFRSLGRRRTRIAVVLAVWAIFSVLGVMAAGLSQIAAFIVILLAWVVLPGVAALFQSRLSSYQSRAQ